MPAAGSCIRERRQPDGARRCGDGVGQLLHDARRQAGAGPRVQLGGGRSDLPRSPSRRARIRLLGQPVRARPGRRRQDDSREQLPDDDRRSVRSRVCGSGSGAGAADSSPDPDEAGHGAGLGMGALRRSPDALGPGLRPAEARLHPRVRGGAVAGPLHAGPQLRDDTACGEGLVPVFARPFHAGEAARGSGGHGLLRPAQRLLDGAHGADVHGRSRAAHCLRERCEPAHRACVRAAAGDRREAVARSVARPPRAAAARRESGAVVRRCRDGGVPVGCAHAESVVARPVRLFTYSDQREAGSADSRLHADPHVAHWRDLRPRAGAAREPRRPLGDAQGHGRIHRRVEAARSSFAKDS